jgi:hypothetical protein
MAHHHFDWKPAFLAALRELPVIAHACKAVGIERSTAYRARETDEDFANAWDDAMEEGIDRAEQEAFRRAVVGFEEPVIDKGRLAYRYERYEDEDGAEHYRLQLDANGQPIPLTVRKHSDALLALYLKGRRKKVYAERTEVTGADGGPVAQVDETAKAARVAQLLAIAQQRKDFEDLA